MKGKFIKNVTTSLVASVIAMSTATALLPAFAAGNTTDSSTTATTGKAITIENAPANSTFTAYQIFKGRVSTDGSLADIEWGDGIDDDAFLGALQGEAAFSGAFDEAETADDVAKVLEANKNDADFVKKFAEIAEENVDGSGKSGAYTAGTGYVINDLADGYYIVLDKSTETPETAIPILQIAGSDVNYHIKIDSAPTSKKTILDADAGDVAEDGKTAVAGVGSTITYQIEVSLPTNYDSFNGYALYFHDILPDELTLDETSISLWVDDNQIGENITATQPSGWTPYYALTNSNELYVYILDLKQIADTATKDSKIKLQYTTIVNDNATADEAIINEANILYPTDPDHGGWPTWDPDGPPDPDNPDDPNNEDPKEPGDPDYPWNDDLPGDPDPEDPDDPDTPPRQPENPPPSNPDDPEDYDPDDEDTMEETTPDTTSTWVFEIDMDKTDGKNNALDGVGFTIKQGGKVAIFADGYKFVAFVSEEEAEDLEAWAADDGAELLEAIFGEDYADVELSAEVFTGAEGKLELDGLAPGTYTFSETTPKDGYDAVSDFEVTLTAEMDDDSYTGKLDENDTEADFVAETGNIGDATLESVTGGVANLAVIDPPASILPGTGGAGVYFYYIVGGGLVGLATLGMIYAKKKKEENA